MTAQELYDQAIALLSEPGQRSEVIVRLTQAIALAPDNVEYVCKRGELRMDNHNWQRDALGDFELALSIDPNAWRPLFLRGLVKVKLGLSTSAVQDLEDATFEFLDRTDVQNLTQAVLALRQKFELLPRLAGILERLGEAQPSAMVFALLAEQYLPLERFEDAAAAARTSIELDSKFTTSLQTLAFAQSELDDHEGALATWLLVLEQRPRDSRAKEERNRLLELLGREPEPIAEVETGATKLENLDKEQLVSLIRSVSALLRDLPEWSDEFESRGDFHSFLVELATMGDELSLGRFRRPRSMQDH